MSKMAYPKKLYSEILKGTSDREPSMMTVLGLSLAREFELQLLPGAKIKRDGNCIISWAFDQIQNRLDRY